MGAMLVYKTNYSQRVFWEFDSIIMQNLSSILPLFCTPTWPSHHVSENQELNSICPEIIFDQNITSVSLSLVLIGKEDNLWNHRDHCSLFLKMGKNKVWVSSGEGLWEDRCVFFIYLSSQHILTITPLVKKAWEQASVTDFAIFIFSAQLNSDTDQSDKPKTPKFISKSLITPLV